MKTDTGKKSAGSGGARYRQPVLDQNALAMRTAHKGVPPEGARTCGAFPSVYDAQLEDLLACFKVFNILN